MSYGSLPVVVLRGQVTEPKASVVKCEVGGEMEQIGSYKSCNTYLILPELTVCTLNGTSTTVSRVATAQRSAWSACSQAYPSTASLRHATAAKHLGSDLLASASPA